ncbi:hypothetical protein JTB14_007040 [Gonioctena quinquepunctata]|nr:hypothetical protein JTB14_007040 [Gonioctena quinquepunctata]
MRDNNFFKWNDEEFRARFRYEVTNEEKVLITLRYLATGSTLQAVGDFTGIDKSTASRIIHKLIISAFSADIRSISVINMRLSLLEYMRYIGGTHSSRCVYEGEEVLNAGHVILCGKLNSSTSEKLNLCALCLQTSALTSDSTNVSNITALLSPVKSLRYQLQKCHIKYKFLAYLLGLLCPGKL